MRPSKERPEVLSWKNTIHICQSLHSTTARKTVTIVSFPSHRIQNSQPLDRSVYGPLKTYVNTACEVRITNHPGQYMTIYDFPGNINKRLNIAVNPANIRGSNFWSLEFLPTMEILSVFLRSRQTRYCHRQCSIEQK